LSFITGIIDVFSVHFMKAYRRSGGIAPLILNLGTRLRGVVSLTHWVLYPQGKSRYPLRSGLDGPGDQSGLSRFLCSGHDSNPEPYKRYPCHYTDYKLHMKDILTV